jgi:hypothetical protein
MSRKVLIIKRFKVKYLVADTIKVQAFDAHALSNSFLKNATCASLLQTQLTMMIKLNL